MKLYLIFNFLLYLHVSSAAAGTGNSLDKLLSIAFEQNQELKAVKADSVSEKELITSKYNLDSPTVGISELDRGNKTRYITIGQKIRFPTKYYLEGKAQKSRYKASLGGQKLSRLNLRENIINLYYKLYSAQKTIKLTKANLRLVKDSARIAETKYASGKSSQSNAMKAHLEITQIEIDLLNLEKKEETFKNEIEALINNNSSINLNLKNLNLAKPNLKMIVLNNISNKIQSYISVNSPAIKIQKDKLNAAVIDQKASKWEFAPDFQVQYQQRISGFPENSKIISINASIPLWFWKNSANASQKSAKANAVSYRYQNMVLNWTAKFKTLKSRIEKTNKTLTIYATTLMPQADGAYRSTRSAYKAGKTSFLNLLDSERSLYKIKQNYYKSLTHLIVDITAMETLIGESISNLSGLTEALQ